MARPPQRVSAELVAGLAAWTVVGLPVLIDGLRGELVADGARLAAWLATYVLFGGVFGAVASGSLDALPYRTHRMLLLLSTSAALATMALLPAYGTSGILLILTATVAAHVLPGRAGFAWIVGQAAAASAIWGVAYQDPAEAILQGVAFLSFMAFGYLTTRSGLREAAAKEALARRNAELRATRHLLVESHRAGERLRIARELHDVLGHHLTALILNLDVAGRRSEGAAREAVTKAHGVAKLLMSDVREAVEALRHDDAIDVAAAIRTLVQDVPEPSVRLIVPATLAVADTRQAHVLLRCVQEVITNAMKHADARTLWIEIRCDGSGVTLTARDDGRGADERMGAANDGPPTASGPTADDAGGFGLAAMRARLEDVGGRLEIRTRPGEGFALSAHLPSGVP